MTRLNSLPLSLLLLLRLCIDAQKRRESTVRNADDSIVAQGKEREETESIFDG